MSHRTLHILFACLLAIAPAGASAAGQPAPTTAPSTVPALAPVRAVVSIPPLRGLIEPLLPPGSTIDVLIPPGTSEHGYEIPPARLATLLQADLVVTIGLGLEPQVDKFLNDSPRPDRRQVVFAKVMKLDDPTGHQHHDHAEGHECTHGVEGSDPHLWLDPLAAISLVNEVANQLAALRPRDGIPPAEHPVRIAAHAQMQKLEELDETYKRTLAAAPNRTIIVAHDAFGYLCARYHLQALALKGLTAQEPKPADLARAIQAIREQKLRTVFVEPQISPRASQRVAEATGADIAVLDPLGSGDYFAMMSANLAELRKALVPTPSTPPPAPTPSPNP